MMASLSAFRRSRVIQKVRVADIDLNEKFEIHFVNCPCSTGNTVYGILLLSLFLSPFTSRHIPLVNAKWYECKWNRSTKFNTFPFCGCCWFIHYSLPWWSSHTSDRVHNTKKSLSSLLFCIQISASLSFHLLFLPRGSAAYRHAAT